MNDQYSLPNQPRTESPNSPENNSAGDEEALSKSKIETADLNRLRERQARLFDAVFSSINDFVYTFDMEGRFLFANQSLLDLWGIKLEAAVGKNFFDLNYPDDLAVRLAEQIQEVFRNGKTIKDETLYLSPTGISGFYEYIFSPVLAADGSTELVAGTTRDITAHKQIEEKFRYSEELLQGTINALTGHIAVLNKDNIIVKVNKSWRKFAEENLYRGIDYGIGQNYLEACLPFGNTVDQEGSAAAQGIRRVAGGEMEIFELEYPCHSPTEQRWFMMRVTRFDGSKDSLRVVVAHENITGRKLAEAALKDANRRKDEFLATLAHELRNPLAPIRSGLEIIRRLGDDQFKLDETLDIIARQTGQIVHLVDDLLDISRITQGKINLKKERIELRTAISMALETSRELIDEADNELTVSIPAQPIYLDADLTRIAQIFLNILNNAAKYSNRGGKITLTAGKEENKAVIRIKDTGLGIAPEMLSEIFEMFGQIETPDKEARGGLGIGLSVVKKMAEMHGGTVEALSEGIGKGSEFIVCLPLAAEQSELISAARVSETDILQTTQMKMPDDGQRTDIQLKAAHRRILVVDDNRDAAEMLETLLLMQGHTIRTAFDAKIAIEIAEEFKPEICLSDIGLPGMNGYELAAYLRRLLPPLLLISISGWGRNEDRQRSKAAGFDYHLVKPVEFNDLLNLIEIKREN